MDLFRKEANAAQRGSQSEYGVSPQIPSVVVEVESHGSAGKRYFTWRVRVSGDDDDEVLCRLARLERDLASVYGHDGADA